MGVEGARGERRFVGPTLASRREPTRVMRSLASSVLLSLLVGLGALGCASRGDGLAASSSDAGPEAASPALASVPSSAASAAKASAKPSDAPSVAQGGGPAASAEAPKPACPAGMLLVEGGYCPEPLFNCLDWIDPPGEYHEYRCAKYGKPVCKTQQRTPMRFCIDALEYTKPGDTLPEAHHSWTSAAAVCAAQGKRLCNEAEWQFACEGPDMHPYPYGDGLTRDATACNIDRTNLGRANHLTDYREPSGARARCVSPFGVHDMSGNVEEWATQEHPPDPRDRSTMKGAWWLPGRNTCRARTVGHGETYEGSQVGVRCCSAAK